jgi:hypothetical protein
MSQNRPRRGRRVNAKGRSVGSDRYLRLPHFMLSSAAWRSLEALPRALFIEVAAKYNGFNNGAIGLGIREAGAALHVKRQTAVNAFRVLQDRGFLLLAKESGFDQKRLAREWVVTLFPVGDERASMDFMRWQPPDLEKQKLGPFGDTHRPPKGALSPVQPTAETTCRPPNGTLSK